MKSCGGSVVDRHTAQLGCTNECVGDERCRSDGDVVGLLREHTAMHCSLARSGLYIFPRPLILDWHDNLVHWLLEHPAPLGISAMRIQNDDDRWVD